MKAISPLPPISRAVRRSGDTQEEAIREMQDAMSSWLEACAKMGRPLAEPHAKPQKAAA